MTERPKTTLAVYLLLQRDDDLLFIRRQNSGWRDGSYTLVAGHVDEGESARAAMVREAAEEVGVVTMEHDLELVHTMHRNDRSPYVDLYFRCTRWTGEPVVMEAHKAGDLIWAPSRDLPEDVIDTVRLAIDAIVDGRAYSDDGWAPSSPPPAP